jgi:translocon-associated protein subunit gamma
VDSDDIDVILNDYGRNLSGVSSVMLYGMAVIVACVPLWLYWRIHLMDPMDSAPVWAVMTLLSAFLIAKAYTNTKHVVKHRVAQKIEKAITREITTQFAEKNISKKEKDDRTHWKKNEVAESQSVSFSLFYNNIIFLCLVIVFSFFVLKNLTPFYNYIGTIASSAGILALLSTSSK